jgi:transposase
VARATQTGLVAAEADNPCTRARRGGDRALGEDDLAVGKKNATRQGATIVFIDESGFSERPSVQRTWAPRGKTPVLSHRFSHWKNLSAIGAVAYSPHGRRARFFLSLVPGAVRSEHIIRFLKRLHQHHPGPLIVIWDGVNPHRSLATREFVECESRWLTLIRLPAYAPELNPVEGAWSWFKRTVVGNFCPEGHGALHRALRLARRRLTRRRPLLRGFLHKSGLSLP